jgi:hypothetical protein
VSSFIVFYYGNTGSSWLIQTLGSARGVLIPAFEPLESWAWKADNDEKLAWIRNAVAPPDQREGPAFQAWVEGLSASPQFAGLPEGDFDTVGFKVSAGAVRDWDALVGLLAETSTRLVFLQRENRIKHALSLYRYHDEGKSQFELAGVRPPSKVKMRVFSQRLRDSVSLHDQSNSLRERCLEALGPEMITTVMYEEFVTAEGKKTLMERLAAFLGLDRASMSHSGFEKATSDDLRSAVVNYERLRRRYRKTPYAQYFPD